MNKRLRVVYVTISLVLALCIIFLASIIISRNINYSRTSKEEILKYKLTNNIDYKVNVSDINYYKNEISNENIISSIINDINLNFNYKLDLNQEINTYSKYTITSKLVINQLKDIRVIPLLTEEDIIINKTVNNSNNICFSEYLVSDYKKFSEYVAKYKATYPLEGLDAKIIYTFKVNTRGIYNNEYLEDESESSITISLLNNITSIKKSGNEYVSRSLTVEKEVPFIKNELMFILGIVIFLIGIFLLIPLFMAIKLVNKQNEYRNTIKHFLKVYDDVIVESSSIIKTNKKQIIEVTTFYELLDAYQELHIPVVFTEVEKDKEAWFTISNNKKIWRFILKNKNIS